MSDDSRLNHKFASCRISFKNLQFNKGSGQLKKVNQKQIQNSATKFTIEHSRLGSFINKLFLHYFLLCSHFILFTLNISHFVQLTFSQKTEEKKQDKNKEAKTRSEGKARKQTNRKNKIKIKHKKTKNTPTRYRYLCIHK